MNCVKEPINLYFVCFLMLLNQGYVQDWVAQPKKDHHTRKNMDIYNFQVLRGLKFLASCTKFHMFLEDYIQMKWMA